MLYALCSMLYALCSMLYALCIIFEWAFVTHVRSSRDSELLLKSLQSTAHQELPPFSFNKQIFANLQYDNNFDPGCPPIYYATASEKTVTTDHEHGDNLKQKKDVACQTTIAMGAVEHSKREFKRKSTAVPMGERQKLRRVKATEREKRRYEVLNNAFERLKQVVPTASQQTKNVDALKMASHYILALTQMLEESEKK